MSVDFLVSIAPVFSVTHTDVTLSLWPSNVSKHLPETALQSFVVMSLVAVSTCSPFEMKAAAITSPVWSSKVKKHLPVSVHQTPVLPSTEVVNTLWLCEEKAAELNDNHFSGLWMVRWHWPNVMLQTFFYEAEVSCQQLLTIFRKSCRDHISSMCVEGVQAFA